MALGSLSACFQTLLALCCLLLLACWDPALGSAVLSNSNSIKNMPGGQGTGYPVSASPDFIAQDTGNKNHQALDSYQPFSCVDDDDCAFNEFCYGSRGGSAHVCLACRKRRKRCLRDAMCCPGNYCNNGVCVPNDQEPEHVQPGDIDETILESVTHDHGTMDTQPKRTTSPSRVHHLKGREGDVCLRSSDCSEGLCCARHFWSKICKPVLTEGQVCTKHRRKGSHGLEIFQRCDCGEGLACRTQREHAASRTSRLHTCQRH